MAGRDWKSTMLRLPLVLCLLVNVSGCGNGNLPDLNEVSAVVLLDSEPLADATVTFRPAQGGRSSIAVTDELGVYVLRYTGTAAGTVLGVHNVRVSKKSLRENTAKDDSEDRFIDVVPTRYREPSELNVTIVEGANTHEFLLTTDP